MTASSHLSLAVTGKQTSIMLSFEAVVTVQLSKLPVDCVCVIYQHLNRTKRIQMIDNNAMTIVTEGIPFNRPMGNFYSLDFKSEFKNKRIRSEFMNSYLNKLFLKRNAPQEVQDPGPDLGGGEA